jgi:hypothetical protein
MVPEPVAVLAVLVSGEIQSVKILELLTNCLPVEDTLV